MYMKGGDALYRYQVQSTTTLPMTPDEIHELGLSEVARITKEFEKVRQEVGFKGDLHALLRLHAHQPQVPAQEPGAAHPGLLPHQERRSRPRCRNISRPVPKTPLVIRPYPPYREKFEAGGSYDSGTPDGSRPGTFYFNAYDLPSRSTWEETTLFLHEGEPGHHFQISLAQENTALPQLHALRRQHRLCRRLGALCRDARLRHGLLQGPVPALRDAQRRDAARDAAGGRHRHPRQGLDPRAGDRLHARPFGHGRRPTPPPRSSATSPSPARRPPTRSAR